MTKNYSNFYLPLPQKTQLLFKKEFNSFKESGVLPCVFFLILTSLLSGVFIDGLYETKSASLKLIEANAIHKPSENNLVAIKSKKNLFLVNNQENLITVE